jgi:hypothetical protein
MSDDHSDNNDPSPDLDRLMADVEGWLAEELVRRRTAHEAQHGAQLALLAPIEGINMVQVRDYLMQLHALETVLDLLGSQRTALYAEMKDRGLPHRTIKAALRIARATLKRDASQAVLDKMVALALSLMPEEEHA